MSCDKVAFIGVRRFDLYVLSAVVSPFAKAMVVAILLLALEQMLRLFDVIVTDRGPLRVVWLMLLNLLPEYFGLAIPIGFLVGILFGFRRLAQENALDAMYAAGLSLRRILAPICWLSFVFSFATLAVVGIAQPRSAYEFERLGFLVQNGAYGLRLQPGEFVSIDKNTVIRIGEIDEATGEYRRVFIEACTAQEACVVTTAERAEWDRSLSGSRLALKLFDGRQFNPLRSSARSGVLVFDTLDFPIHPPSTPVFRERGEVGKETSLPDLFRGITGPGSVHQENFHENRARFHWIVLHSIMVFAIPFLGAAFSIVEKRAVGVAGPVCAVLLQIAYIQLLKAGEFRAGDGAAPWLVMWPVFGVFLLISLTAMWIASEKPGGLSFSRLVGRSASGIAEFTTTFRRTAQRTREF